MPDNIALQYKSKYPEVKNRMHPARLHLTVEKDEQKYYTQQGYYETSSCTIVRLFHNLRLPAFFRICSKCGIYPPLYDYDRTMGTV